MECQYADARSHGLSTVRAMPSNARVLNSAPQGSSNKFTDRRAEPSNVWELRPSFSQSLGRNPSMGHDPAASSSSNLPVFSTQRHQQDSAGVFGARGALARIEDPAVQDLRCQNWRTSYCRFFKVGRCFRGDDCTFAHYEEELMPELSLIHTRLCKDYTSTGRCRMGGNCKYAHSQEELLQARTDLAQRQENALQFQDQLARRPDRCSDKTREHKFRTRMCKFFEAGTCRAGDECGYAHYDYHLQPEVSLYRTELCYDFESDGYCRRGAACKYAHGRDSLLKPTRQAKSTSSTEHETRHQPGPGTQASMTRSSRGYDQGDRLTTYANNSPAPPLPPDLDQLPIPSKLIQQQPLPVPPALTAEPYQQVVQRQQLPVSSPLPHGYVETVWL
eukprot:gb/GFBE01035982.1/.p1 GENE.gb/GFBE01035982.1/~~gb/GFBE01035982.1/.p1  ORF type:complete len:389 (+),score=7.87 gb/GFBE01035982.1/:1-1167(+)